MIRFKAIEREAFDVRSNFDRRKRVDAWFCSYSCPPDSINPDGPHDWICRFEVPRGTAFKPVLSFTDKRAARIHGGNHE